MTELFEPSDIHDHRLALSGAGPLAAFNAAGVLSAGDLHVAATLARLVGEQDMDVILAAALAARAVQHGSVCLDPITVREVDPTLPWPEPTAWLTAIRSSALVAEHVLVVEHGLVYLDRYWRDEVAVHADLTARVRRPAPPVRDELVRLTLDRVFPATGYEEQRAAVDGAARRWLTVLTGGPGTGKTTTVAGLLAVLSDQLEQGGRPVRIALAAPTGKAAAQLEASVRRMTADHADTADTDRLSGARAMTLHRLLGWRPGSNSRFTHDRTNRLPHDVVVVDETSMVSLSMMARLLEAVRPDARLVFVGDADQLASVDAGAVLGDVVRGFGNGPGSPVERLLITHRFEDHVGELAAAIRDGDGDAAMAVLSSGHPDVEWVDADSPTPALREALVSSARAMHEHGASGDVTGALAALTEHRLLCAHREGPAGVRRWNRQVQAWLAEDLGEPLRTTQYPGRPLLVTSNDHALGVYNGDTGVLVSRHGTLRALIDGAGGAFEVDPNRLPDTETVHAMTIHKSQGSQADEITVVLPDAESRLLTRELLYTAITRARKKVRIVGSEASLRAAVGRRVQRASGLQHRLLTP